MKIITKESLLILQRRLSDPIEVTKGLRQGCSLSPILFNIYLEKTLDHFGEKLPMNESANQRK